MIMRAFAALGLVAALAACDVTPVIPSGPAVSPPQNSARTNARNFVQVVNTVEPVAERECRARTTNLNCDFNIVVDDRPGQPANAFQTLDRQGRPIIAFTLALIDDARNEDDALGTIITQRAGYDPIRGAAFFTRIPDPGDRFLGTHPPNASRIEIVRRTAAGL